MSLKQIKAEGTTRRGYSRTGKPSNKIVCVDGFTVSVIAGAGAYCTPRPGFDAPDDYEGPYVSAEVGFPSARPEPWEAWSEYCESPDAPTETVYGWVPFSVIQALIALHGGERS